MDSASLPHTRGLDILSSLPADKKIRLSDAEGRHLGVLPDVVLREIVSFTTESSLSGVCRAALVAIRELHYKVDMANYAFRCPGAEPAGADLANHMGLEASGALATGRAVVRITITTVVESANESRHHARYKALEQAVGRVVRHSIPTLREITIRGFPTWNGRARVSAILGEAVPPSAKRHRVAPRLSRVHLVDDATGVAKAGRAVAAGLWSALELLTFSHCRANAGHLRDLARGLRSGLAPRLRVLGWDDQSSIRETSIDDVILGALSWGKCPLVESLSFTGNRFCPEHSIGYLEEALWVCPRLRELRMDCSRTPHRQLRVLAGALEGGHVPRLEKLLVRATAPYYRDSDVELLALKRAAASSSPPVELELHIKTRLK
ncbi:unnamed protein product [Ectocarpus sp. CCAP 1310/34]|nr:unnamed protein product [Ectocarpus sp. CCAP 1310/34]